MSIVRHYEEVGKLLEDAVPKWISMEERKPKNGQRVLTIDSIGKQEVCYYNEVKNAFGECAWLSYIYNITHWMPLPEPPKEDKGE